MSQAAARGSLKFITSESPQEFSALRDIFRDYANELQIDLCFQGFESELADLPGGYA